MTGLTCVIGLRTSYTLVQKSKRVCVCIVLHWRIYTVAAQRNSKTKCTRDAHTKNCSGGLKTSFTRRGGDDQSARTSVRDWGHHVMLWSPPPPPPAYRGTHALARTHDAYDHRVQWVKHLRPLPCDKAAAAYPRAEVVRPRAHNTRPSKSLKPV